MVFGDSPKVMGILNVTPDSFSDGGRFNAVDSAVERALEMLDSGTDVIDVGGESTRPDATPVPYQEESARIAPVIKALKKERPDCIVSADTMKSETATAALDAGADIINDITGLRNAPEIADIATKSGAGLILMHMRGTPATMRSLNKYDDLVAEVSASLLESAKLAESAGVEPAAIMLDPGIGFAKDTAQNLEILRCVREFSGLGYPLMVGPSRKNFIGEVLSAKGEKPPPDERGWGTAGAVGWLAFQKVEMVRVHEPREARDVLTVIRSIENGN